MHLLGTAGAFAIVCRFASIDINSGIRAAARERDPNKPPTGATRGGASHRITRDIEVLSSHWDWFPGDNLHEMLLIFLPLGAEHSNQSPL